MVRAEFETAFALTAGQTRHHRVDLVFEWQGSPGGREVLGLLAEAITKVAADVRAVHRVDCSIKEDGQFRDGWILICSGTSGSLEYRDRHCVRDAFPVDLRGMEAYPSVLARGMEAAVSGV